MSPLPTLRQRKKVRTRDALAAAALRLSRERGYERVTIDDITAEAEVSRRTFFRYFASKEAALFPRYGLRLAHFRDQLRERPHGEAPFETVERAFLAVARLYMRERDEIVAQQRVVDASPSLVAFERLLDRDWERAVATALEPARGGGGSAGRRARVLAGATMGAVRATLREWFDGGGRADLVALGREAFALLAMAGAPAARAGGGRR
ncbi:MAG TPA: TetR family transcriptional regulator [Candidatus Binatia bacterium]|nr:TetR family transcriptional regulator [Candidatus Binatia bacterium]